MEVHEGSDRRLVKIRRILLFTTLFVLFLLSPSPFPPQHGPIQASSPRISSSSLPNRPTAEGWDWNPFSGFFHWLDQLPTTSVRYGYWLPSNIPDMIPNVYASGNSANYGITSIRSTSDPSTITCVQGGSGCTSTSISRGTATSGSSVSVTLANTPANGDALIATVSLTSSSAIQVSSISETGATWAKQAAHTGNGWPNDEIWATFGVSGASTSVTVNLSVSIGYGVVVDIAEFSGLASSPLDQNASNSGSGTSCSTGTTSTTTQSNELWIGGCDANAGTSSIAQSSPTNGFTLIDGVNFTDSNGNYSTGSLLYKIVSSTGAANTGVTFANSVSGYAGAIATFAGTPGPPPPPPSDFTITATTPSQTVGAGATASYTLTITYSSTLTATVNLAVTSGCPSGVSCTVGPNSVSGSGTAMLNVPTLITTPSGTTSVTVTASSSSPSLSHMVTVQLTVTGPGSYAAIVHAGVTQVVVTVTWTGSGTVSVTLAGPGGTPTLSESGQVVYDRLTYASGSSTPTNIHRVTFNISSYSPTSVQTWTVLVSLSASYTVTIEVS